MPSRIRTFGTLLGCVGGGLLGYYLRNDDQVDIRSAAIISSFVFQLIGTYAAAPKSYNTQQALGLSLLLISGLQLAAVVSFEITIRTISCFVVEKPRMSINILRLLVYRICALIGGVFEIESLLLSLILPQEDNFNIVMHSMNVIGSFVGVAGFLFGYTTGNYTAPIGSVIGIFSAQAIANVISCLKNSKKSSLSTKYGFWRGSTQDYSSKSASSNQIV